MERRYQYQPTPNFFRILVEIDGDLLARIDAFAEEREESRQALLGRFVEGGLQSLLTLLGGGAGILLGSGVTAVYATLQGWPTVVPAWVMAGGITAALLMGGVAGLYPAIRAARLAPTEALAAT